jgi:flavin-dependent dehydrogenase
MSKTIKIGGAGISGLITAINLAKAGYNVQIFDSAKDSGNRFSNDFQGIENWSYKEDVLDFLKRINIKVNFYCKGSSNLSVWAPGKEPKNFTFQRPLYYMVKRGLANDSLDQSLKEQALSLGVKIIYNHRVIPQDVNIVATGPILNDKSIDGMVSGYTFDTDMNDYHAVILNENYAPNGYSYFLVQDNRGTIASCSFKDYKNLNKYREETLEFCRKSKSFKMNNVKKFSGTGNFFIPRIPKDRKIYIGEASGFQDYLFGFGMRYAMISGYYAANSIILGKNYYKLCKKDIIYKMKSSVINRILFSTLNNSLYIWLIKKYSDKNSVDFITRLYQYAFFKKIIYPLASIFERKNIKDPRF